MCTDAFFAGYRVRRLDADGHKIKGWPWGLPGKAKNQECPARQTAVKICASAYHSA